MNKVTDMISNSTALQELRESWNGVRKLRSKVQVSLLGSFAQGGSAAIFAADIAHNLPFIHACSVLNDVLLQLRDESHFKCTRFFLGSLMAASKSRLPWTDFDLVKEGVDWRNADAHHGDIVPRGDCWKYIDAIERELINWNIVAPQ